MAELKDLVSELMSLNNENLSKRVINDNDVQWCLSELYDMLAVDVVEVVRCKECKYYKKGSCDCHSVWPDQYSTGYDCRPDDDDFCSYGEREDKQSETD